MDLYNIIIVFIVVIDKVIDYTLLIYNSFYEFFFTALQLWSNFGLIILWIDLCTRYLTLASELEFWGNVHFRLGDRLQADSIQSVLLVWDCVWWRVLHLVGPLCRYEFVTRIGFSCVLDEISIDDKFAHLLDLKIFAIRCGFRCALFTSVHVRISIAIFEQILLSD